jgi:hypothetical protein
MIERATGILIDAAGAALRADAGVIAAFGDKPVKVMEVVPEAGPTKTPAYPYVTFGAAEKRRLKEYCGAARARVTLFVQVWDSNRSIRRVSDIAEACELPLIRLVLDPSTNIRLTAREHQLTRCNYDAERQLLYGLCQIEFEVSALTA